jgi:hypothetical protein
MEIYKHYVSLRILRDNWRWNRNWKVRVICTTFRGRDTTLLSTVWRHSLEVKPKYSGPAGYDRLYIRPTWVSTKIFVLTYDQISSYDPRQRQRDDRISGITCSSLRTLAVFALFCRRDHANSSYQSTYSINKYRVTEKGCLSLTARSSINQALRPAWRS